LEANPAASDESPQAAKPRGRSPCRITATLLLLIVGLAASLRFYHIDRYSLWLDEFFSLASSAGRYPGAYKEQSPLPCDQLLFHPPHPTSMSDARPWSAIWANMHEGTHPPLYIYVLRMWRDLFGDSGYAARALSAVASIGAILLLFDVGRLLFGVKPALWSAALMAVAWPQLQYGQEARPYALLLLFGAAAMSAIIRIEILGPNLRRLCALFLFSLALAFTHYFSFGALLTLPIYALVWLRGKARWQALAALSAAAIVFLIAWGPALWEQRRHIDYSFVADTYPSLFGRTLQRWDEMVPHFFIDQGELDAIRVSRFLGGIGWAFYLAIAISIYWRPRLLLPFLWLISTGLFLGGLDLARHTSHLGFPRYILLASLGLYLLIPAVLAKWKWPMHIISALLVIGCLLAAPAYYEVGKQDWRSAGALVHQNVRPTETVVFATGDESWWASAIYIGIGHYDFSPNRPTLILDAPPNQANLKYLNSLPRFWLISNGLSDPTRYFPGCHARLIQSFGMATLWEIVPAGRPAL
jgi:uncharacterized membrane protein